MKQRRTVLIELSNKTTYFGEVIQFDSSSLWKILVAKNPKEFENILKLLVRKKFITYSMLPFQFAITISMEGWEYISELKKSQPISNQAFVAMWFNSDLNDVWVNGFKAALEDNELGYKPIRIDQQFFDEKISDRIIAEIKKSSLVIVDLTGFRSMVFYEGGFAQGLGRQVIWTCHEKDHPNIKDHFDINHYQIYKWSTPEDLRETLKNAIIARVDVLPVKRKV